MKRVGGFPFLLLACIGIAFLPPSSQAQLESESAVESAKRAYAQSRNEGIGRVLSEYKTNLETMLEERMKAADLEGATAVRDEIRWIDQFLEGAGDAGSYPFPEFSGELKNQAALSEARERASSRLKRGLRALNLEHSEQLEPIQKSLVQEGQLEEAVALRTFRDALDAEMNSLGGGAASSSRPSVPAPAAEAKPVDLLAESMRGRWKEQRGNWTFRKESLIGEGDSRIDCTGPFEPPFELRFDLEVEEGQRPRVYLGRYTLGHDGYDFALTLHPRPKEEKKVHPYQRNRRLRIRLRAEQDAIELHVNDRLLERREGGITEPLPSIGFSGGDGWSPGRTRFDDIEIISDHLD